MEGTRLERLKARIDAARTAPRATGPVDAITQSIRDGLRAEAAPLSRQVAELRGLTNGTIRRLERMEQALQAEREARVEDLAVLVVLVTASWKTVDERLARIEAALGNGERGATVYRLEEVS
jgi:hypothetical protein